MKFASQKPLFLRSFPPTSLWAGVVAGVILSSLPLTQANAQEATPTPAATPAPEVQLPANAGPNVALNKKYVSSDPNPSGWNVGLVDGSWKEGSPTTFATGKSAEFPKNVTIDLETPVDLSMVLVGVPRFGATKTVVVSLSTDGTTFKDVGSYVFSEKTTEKHLYSFPPTSARYVRLTYVDHYEKGNGYDATYAFTTEVEAYAPTK